ncbi:MAG: helix-turn-helix transcriptional regulator [Candidatus Omnitrophica bacterium]|nr:helix-turn-helix transcriptional regulator [Candidatus Omnitrophota bacterium]
MKKSIFDKKMEDKKFRAIYEEVSAKMSVGEQIAKYRYEAKISQAELAEKAKTSRTAIARYERGNYDKYNITTLKKIAHALNKNLTISIT